jgi:hypothetical protein
MLNKNMRGFIPAAKKSFEKWLTKLFKLYVDFLFVTRLEVSMVETLLDIHPRAMSRNEPLFA